MKKEVLTDEVPKPIGLYSQAIRSGNLVFLSGIIPLDPVTGEIVRGDIKEPLNVFKNASSILKAL